MQANASPLKRQRPTPLLSVFACLILSVPLGDEYFVGLCSLVVGETLDRAFYRFMTFQPIREEAAAPSRCATTHHEASTVPLLMAMEYCYSFSTYKYWLRSSLQLQFSRKWIWPIKRHHGSPVCCHVIGKGASFKSQFDNFRCI